jgi:hypothetical protein
MSITPRLTPAQRDVVSSGNRHHVIQGGPQSGKSTVLAERVRHLWQAGLAGDRVLVLTPDRRSARRLNRMIGTPPVNASGRIDALSYHSFAQDLIRRWWPLVMQHLGINSTTPEFLPFNLAQYACLNEYRLNPGNLQRLTIREQRLIVQVLSNMNLSAANELSLEDGWERVALGLGVAADDVVIQDGLDLTRRFRERCREAGVLPVDLQVESAGWLLGQDRVRDDVLARYDLLALDDLDEFVPLMAERLTSLASEAASSIVVCSDDGGLRWLLGASVQRVREICRDLVEQRSFTQTRLEGKFPGDGEISAGSASWLAGSLAGSPADPPVDLAGWQRTETNRPDEMAGAVVAAVATRLAEGVVPERIVLLIPYMDTLVSTGITQLCRQLGIPFRIDRRWQSVLDDPLSRACLTALRCVNPGMSRRATRAEVADLLTAITGANPLDVQPWARALFQTGTGKLIDVRRQKSLPYEVRRLGWWASRVSGEDPPGLHSQLETFARHVLAPHSSPERADLIRACYALATEARRFRDAAPRLGLEQPMAKRFFEYVDSDVVGADSGVELPEDSVTLTTPYAFLTSGRTASVQYWLNVASPSWWEPPLLLLTNPHAVSSGKVAAPLTSADEERIRSDILGRMIRNLAARCDGDIHVFAAFSGSDGAPLEGPLYDCLLEMGVPAA